MTSNRGLRNIVNKWKQSQTLVDQKRHNRAKLQFTIFYLLSVKPGFSKRDLLKANIPAFEIRSVALLWRI